MISLWLEPQIYTDLLLINDIRNVFAHTLYHANFNNRLIEQDCYKLQSIMGPPPKSAKEKYTHNVITIYFSLSQRCHTGRSNIVFYFPFLASSILRNSGR
jgi:hypothetical protein